MPYKKIHFIFEIALLAIIFLLSYSCWKLYHKAPQTNIPSPTPQASPTSIANIDIIPGTPSFDERYCVAPFVNWSKYIDSTIDATLMYKGDSDSSEKPPYYTKANIFYEGRVLNANGLPALDYFGNSLFAFKENGNIHKLPVHKRIKNSLAGLENNAAITIFMEKRFGFLDPDETLVQDFSATINSLEKPDNHWQVEIIQDGNIYDQNSVRIKNSPFTVRAYLPRMSDKILWPAMNLKDSTEILQSDLIGTNLKQSCIRPIRTTPKTPFCPGSGSTFEKDRSLTISAWEYVFFSFWDCSHNNLSDYEIESSNISVEKDIFYFKMPADDSNVFTSIENRYLKQPISAFAGKQFTLSFLFDMNENNIIENDEMKIIHLAIVP